MRGRIYFLNFLFSLGYNSVSKILPAFLTIFSKSAFQIGLVNSAYQLGRGLSTIFSGYLSDKIGKNKGVLLGFLLTSLLSFLLVFADSIPFFAFIFFFIGLAASLFYLSLNAVASIIFEKKGEGFSKLEISYQLGFVLAPIIGGVIAISLGMPVVFVLWTLISAIGLIASMGLPKQENEKITIKKTVRSLFSAVESNLLGFIVFVLIGSFFVGLVEGFRDLIIALYAVDLGFTIFEIGVLFAISSIITIIGITPLGKLSDKIGRGSSLFAGLLLVAFSLFLLLHATSLILLAVLTGILSLGRTIGLVSTRAFAADLIPKSVRATGLGLFELVFSAGKVFGPVSAGLLKDTIRVEGTLLVFLIITVGVALLIGLYFVKEELQN